MIDRHSRIFRVSSNGVARFITAYLERAASIRPPRAFRFLRTRRPREIAQAPLRDVFLDRYLAE